MEIAEKLKGYPIFSGLETDEIDDLMKRCTRLELPSGEVLFRQGEPANALYLIESGSVEVAFEREDELQRIASLLEGSVLGELSIMTSATRTATIRATSDTTLFSIDAAKFKELIASNHTGALKLSHNIAVVLAKRLRETDRMVMDQLARLGKKSELYEYRKRFYEEWDF